MYVYRRSRSSYISVSSPEEGDQKPKKGKKDKEFKKQTVKYSAAKLHERGVILEIDGLNTNQYVLYQKFVHGCV